MRRSAVMLLLGVEIGTLSWWLLSVRFETGLDALQYHRMANAIVTNGVAPWVINPLSYIGIYPGSDSSGVPFLTAMTSLVSGSSISSSVLAYDGVLLLVFGLGLFMLARKLTDRVDIAILAILMGSLAYGMFTTTSWSLDERSFNVAVTPLFLLLILPRDPGSTPVNQARRILVVGLVAFIMFVSHLSFLLLVPFLVLIPLLYEVVRRQFAVRQKRRASILYFGAIALSPVALLAGLDQAGLLSSFRLEYQLDNSALFSGSSPLIFVLNAAVFVGTRIGPINIGCGVVGLLYLASRRYLPTRGIVIGGILLAGFLGLPIVLYSKDLLTPIFVVLGAIGLGALVRPSSRRRTATLVLAAVVVVSGSVAFDAWNLTRTSRGAATTYWAMPGVTPEAQSGNLWINARDETHKCAYGNNAVLLQQVTNEPGVPFCTGLPIDQLINSGTSAVVGSLPFRVLYGGISGANPSDWFSSPELTRASDDFARLPGLDFQEGRSLLLSYNVSFIVVDLRRPNRVPAYSYQGVRSSLFFAEVWDNLYPVYRTASYAVFCIQSS